MASYRQYRHQSSSDFGRPQPWSFEMDPYSRYELSSLPVVGDFMRAMDQKKYWNDYMANTGLSWKDVKYPALMGGQRAVGAAVNAGNTFLGYAVSRNLMKLYK